MSKPNKPSKLERVRKALENSSRVTIIRTLENKHLPPSADNPFSHTVDFCVTLKTGHTYDARGLQSLMMSLVPRLKPTRTDSLHKINDESEFGALYFDEDIGTDTARHEIVLTDESVFLLQGFVDGKGVIKYTRIIKRRVRVRLFFHAWGAIYAAANERKR